MANKKESGKKLEEIKKKVAPIIDSVSASTKMLSDFKGKAKTLAADIIDKEDELLINKLTNIYNNSTLDINRMVIRLVDKNHNELCENIKIVFNEAHQNAAILESYKALKKELADMYDAALTTKDAKEKLVLKLETDVNETRQYYKSKLDNLQEQIKISEEKLFIKEEYDNSLKGRQTLKDANGEIRQTNLEYEVKIKEIKSKIAKYKKIAELKNIKNEIAAEQERVSVIARSLEDKRITKNETQQELNIIEQKKAKILHDISEAKNQIDKLDTDYFRNHETLRLECLMKSNTLTQMDEYLSDKSKLSELQTEHDLMESKIRMVKEDITNYQSQISEISQQTSERKQLTDSVKGENTNLLSQLSDLKQTISDQQIKINELNTTLSDANSTKHTIIDELQAELNALIKTFSDTYDSKRKQFEEIQSHNRKKEGEIKKKHEEIIKVSLELEELNVYNEKATKNDTMMKSKIKMLEKMYVDTRRKGRRT